MNRNDLIRLDGITYRVLCIKEDTALLIDCNAKKMPISIPVGKMEEAELIPDTVLLEKDITELSPTDRAVALKRYSMIANVVAAISDEAERKRMMSISAEIYGVSKQTLRTYLCQYLVYQNISVLAPKEKKLKQLTQDQKNMRWALNKYFYNQKKHPLPVAYAYMIRDKYSDETGLLKEKYPSFDQFRYFYRKTKKLENYYISRDGLKDYQMNHRPLLGAGVQEFAPTIGTAMLDATICDIFLINEKNELVGRPVLVVACDANTSLCLGYSLLWEGGNYSLMTLLQNIIQDKVELCAKHGIAIEKEVWNVNQLPAVMVTDMGSEYKGKTFEQITELGVTIVNLPSFRAELKGPVEKLFDLVQSSYKEVLKGKGVIMPDFQKRGAHDYRKDAVLVMEDFEKTILKTIVFYNSKRVIDNYPYSKEMIVRKVKPYASEIWNWMLESKKANLISVSKQDIRITLLPRIQGEFTRHGLVVNQLRYDADGFKERYLRGGSVMVSVDAGDCSKVWIKGKDGSFVQFQLIESRYEGMSLDEIVSMKKEQKALCKKENVEELKAKIQLINFIETVTEKPKRNVEMKDVRNTRKKERNRKRNEEND